LGLGSGLKGASKHAVAVPRVGVECFHDGGIWVGKEFGDIHWNNAYKGLAKVFLACPKSLVRSHVRFVIPYSQLHPTAAPTLTPAQCSETIALEDSRNYFVAFDALTSPSVSMPSADDSLPSLLNSSLTAEQVYEGAITRLTLAGLFAEPGARHSFDMALSLHAATPLIEAFYQYYADINDGDAKPNCDSWVELRDERICDSSILNERLSRFGSHTPDVELVVCLFPTITGCSSV
jgi:hypothetical protein